MSNLYPGAIVYINGIGGQKGSMACFCYKVGDKGIYAMTNAHVVCVGGNPTGNIVANLDVIAPLPPEYSTAPAATIVGKDESTDIALLKVTDPDSLTQDNFCLGKSMANGEIVGAGPALINKDAVIWAGITTERSQQSPKPVVKGKIIKLETRRVKFSGDKTQRGDSGSPICVRSGNGYAIVAVFGNGGFEQEPPFSSFGEEITSALGGAGRILGGPCSLATWGNRSEWL